ncbi:hypothetical protein cco4_00332, partial [Campylobacter coli 7--1]
IKEANDKYIVVRYMEDNPSIYKEALIYRYILKVRNPNPPNYPIPSKSWS